MKKNITIKLLVLLAIAVVLLSACKPIDGPETPKPIKLRIGYERVVVNNDSLMKPRVWCYGGVSVELQEVSPNVFEGWVDAMTEIELTIYVADGRVGVDTQCSMEAGEKIFVNGTKLRITIFTCTNTYWWAGKDKFIVRNNGSIEQ